MAIWFNGLPAEASAQQIIARLRTAGINHPFIAADHERDRAKIQEVIEEAHRHELTIHGDFCKGRLRNQTLRDLAQVLKDGTQQPLLCPANPACVDYVLEELRRVLSAYAYDGITLDDGYYFATGATYHPEAPTGRNFTVRPACYCAYCQRHAPIEQPGWEDWKREKVTALIGKQAQLARELKPGLHFSSAAHMPYELAYYEPHRAEIPYYEGWSISQCRRGRMVDWVEWVRRGHVDFVLPMVYYHSRDLVRWQTDECRSLLPNAATTVWVGLGLGTVTAEYFQGLSDKPGDRAHDPAMKNDAMVLDAQLQDQLRLGQENVAFFCYSELSDEHLPVLARYR